MVREQTRKLPIPSIGTRQAHALARRVLLSIACSTLTLGAVAQTPTGACNPNPRRCLGSCLAAMRTDPAAGRECQDRCNAEAAQCRGEGAAPGGLSGTPLRTLPGGRVVPDLTPRPPGGQSITGPAATPPVTLTAPWSPQDIEKVAAELSEILQQRSHASVNAATPDECEKRNGMIANPAACLALRAQRQVGAKTEANTRSFELLRPAESSLELDLAALPADPVEKIEALAALKKKYQPITRTFTYFDEQAATDRSLQSPSQPLRQLGARFRDRFAEQSRLARADPAVKRAWLDGRIATETLDLPFADALEWNADRVTLAMQRDIKTKLPRATLFSERSDELERSAREQQDGGAFERWGEPSANEIGLALLRVFALTGGEQTSPFESQRVGPVPLLAVAAKTYLAQVVRIVHVERDGHCNKAQGRYECKVRAWQKLLVRGPGVGVFDSAEGRTGWGPIYKALWDEAESHNGEAQSIVLEATSAGWRAPVLTQQLLDADQRLTDAMNRPAKLAECQRRAKRGAWVYLDRDC